MNNDPLGVPWVIATVLPERPTIPLAFDGDASPKKLSLRARFFTVVVLSLGLWSLGWLLLALTVKGLT